jgi:flagellar biosynthesis protein FlhF
MGDLDLVLIDTAGRSPRDEVQIQELRSLLAEARPDEVLLALSSVCQSAALSQAARRFAEVGVTGLVLTKLDEVETHGHWLPLVCQWHWPVRYLACGQHVPRDLVWMDRRRLVKVFLGMESVQ